jgi:hypothetical protein
VYKLALLSLPLFVANAAGSLELQFEGFEPRAPALSLLDEAQPIPAAVYAAMAGDGETALAANAEAFLASLDARSGGLAPGGGGAMVAPENAWLAFVLGLVGFGLGHFAVAGDQRGGTRWLLVDAVFLCAWVVLDVLVSSVIYAGLDWGVWYLVFDVLFPVGWVVEHIFQGLAAYRAATGRDMVGQGGGQESEGELTALPNRALPSVFAWSF